MVLLDYQGYSNAAWADRPSTARDKDNTKQYQDDSGPLPDRYALIQEHN
jgi:hypothetical protein